MPGTFLSTGDTAAPALLKVYIWGRRDNEKTHRYKISYSVKKCEKISVQSRCKCRVSVQRMVMKGHFEEVTFEYSYESSEDLSWLFSSIKKKKSRRSLKLLCLELEVRTDIELRNLGEISSGYSRKS